MDDLLDEPVMHLPYSKYQYGPNFWLLKQRIEESLGDNSTWNDDGGQLTGRQAFYAFASKSSSA